MYRLARAVIEFIQIRGTKTRADRPRQIVLVNCGKVAPKKAKSC